jgi:hypothetical protein
MFLFRASYNLPVQAPRNRPLRNLPLRHQLCVSYGHGLHPKERVHRPVVQSASVQPQRACRYSHHVINRRPLRHGRRSHCRPTIVVYQDSKRSSLHLLDLLISGARIWNCWFDEKDHCVSHKGTTTSTKFMKRLADK